MCGIVGFIENKNSFSLDSSTQTLEQMKNAILHRGPDGHGELFEHKQSWRIALGHRRLSIIDVEAGKQPLGNKNKTIQIIYNGEVYNFLELRSKLESLGHHFQTRSDTEVVVHQYEQYGIDGIKDLNGMFAFAIWDSTQEQLILARDRIGIKPLYYAKLNDGGIVFASELTALLKYPKINKKLSSAGLNSYFFLDYAHPPHTLIEGVYKLEPGHFLIWRKGDLSSPKPFFENVTARKSSLKTAQPEELWDRMQQAVTRQMISDVPVGVFLSGGIDSSVIAALAQSQAKDRLQTFSIAFEDEQYDESKYARLVAQHLKTNHIEEKLTENRLLDILPQALNHLDEPLADPSFLPTYLLSGLAAKHVKVSLGGDGGDELWAGYPTYRAHQYAETYKMIPKFFRKNIVEEIVERLPVKPGYQSFEWKAKRFALRWDDNKIFRHLRWMSSTDITDVEQCLNIKDKILSEVQKTFHSDALDLNWALALDFSTYMPGSVLTKVDRASMANSLEVRPPFLDNKIIEWAFSLPFSLKLNNGCGKYLLKQAAKKHLPEEVVFRKKKGFAIPLLNWLKGPLRPHLEHLFNDSPLWDEKIFNRSVFYNWNEAHQAGIEDRSKPLWSLLVLNHWYTRVF